MARGRRHVGPPNGRITVRAPIDLHAQLVRLADEQDVSLNTLCVSLLAGGSHFELEPDAR